MESVSDMAVSMGAQTTSGSSRKRLDQGPLRNRTSKPDVMLEYNWVKLRQAENMK